MPKALQITELFEEKVVHKTYSFIKSLTPEKVQFYRRAYKREINNTNVFMTPKKVEMRKCFLYLSGS